MVHWSQVAYEYNLIPYVQSTCRLMVRSSLPSNHSSEHLNHESRAKEGLLDREDLKIAFKVALFLWIRSGTGY
jgi:hypothetical protein